MRRIIDVSLAIASVVILVLLVSSTSSAQKLPKEFVIQAQAFGESTQLGQNFAITLIIEEYSTDADKQALLQAFQAKGNEGMVNALSKMHTKGRMSITGTLGYDVAYIRSWPQPDGTTKLRLVTDRPITFGEAWSDNRSMDYSLSGVEIILSADKKKNSGTLMPACKLKLDKENHLDLELLQNAWRLADIMKR